MIASKASNFHDIFGWNDGNKVIGITIPIVQRDYAQGRVDENTTRIRNRFLEVLYDALVEGKKATLDFVYGSVDKGRLIPLDGQQRLTTLFLLHYYIALHEEIADDDWQFLQGFTYETRVSSREFCRHLLSFKPDFQQHNLSEQIKDEAWFLLEWESDPTVLSMLVMLDAIHNKFNQAKELWPQLMGDAITFYFLPLEEMGATDELYIKMNSRGKPLTRFENFKAELELRMKEVDEKKEGEEKLAERIISKMDCQWNDMLWPYRNSGIGKPDDEITDDEYLRYIRFISDIISYKKGEPEIADEFAIIEKHFSIQCSEAYANMAFLEKMFDIWYEDENKQIVDIQAFFNKYISTDKHEEGKILFESDQASNLFRECCRCYGKREGRRSLFPLSQILLLYAFTIYLINKSDDFSRRLRIVHNLIRNSSDSIRSEYMQELLSEVDEIILHGTVNYDVAGSAHFQTEQLKEESLKLQWTKANPEMAETLFRLEDHPYLNGYVRAVTRTELHHVGWCERFYSLFDRDLKLVVRALLATGDFFEKDSWRYQIGTANPNLCKSVWRTMFSPSRLKDNICKTLHDLLEKHERFTDEILSDIAEDYLLKAKEKPVRYYLVKYEQMQKSRWGKDFRYGKFYWRRHWEYNERESEMFQKSYNVIMMTTDTSLVGMNYDIFLKAIYDEIEKECKDVLSLGDYSYRQYKNNQDKDEDKDKLYMTQKHLYLTLSDNVYHICREDTNEIIETYEIKQEKGIDIEDRVLVGLRLLEKYVKQIEYSGTQEEQSSITE